MKFGGGQFLTYNFEEANITEKMATMFLVVGFKTKEANAALMQIVGTNKRHVSLMLRNGYPTLLYSSKEKIKLPVGALIDQETQIIQVLLFLNCILLFG